MTTSNRYNEYGNYGFFFLDDITKPTSQIDSIGLELRTSTEYYFHGIKREEKDRYLFQYTLKGWGIYELGGKTYKVEEGQAFLAEIPGEHAYYFPENGKDWEFIYIMLYGSEPDKYWTSIVDSIGPVPRFRIDSPVINLLYEIYGKAANKYIEDEYQASSLAFQFITELRRAAKKNTHTEYPHMVQTAMRFMFENYMEIYGVEDIASELGISKYHLIRKFTKTVGMTPGKYLSKIRLERAIQLLSNTDKSVGEIGKMVGYSNGNYFCKVFRSYLGKSPGEFRAQQNLMPFTHVTL